MLKLNWNCLFLAPTNSEKDGNTLSAIAVALVIAIPSGIICILGIIAVLWYNRYYNKKSSKLQAYKSMQVGEKLMTKDFQIDTNKKLKDIMETSMSGKNWIANSEDISSYRIVLSFHLAALDSVNIKLENLSSVGRMALATVLCYFRNSGVVHFG